jgi:hypothetical protein
LESELLLVLPPILSSDYGDSRCPRKLTHTDFVIVEEEVKIFETERNEIVLYIHEKIAELITS